MDPADIADITQQTLLDAKIQNHTHEPVVTTNPSEICWADDCDAETGPDKRFCCPDCRDIWQVRNNDLSPTNPRSYRK